MSENCLTASFRFEECSNGNDERLDIECQPSNHQQGKSKNHSSRSSRICRLMIQFDDITGCNMQYQHHHNNHYLNPSILLSLIVGVYGRGRRKSGSIITNRITRRRSSPSYSTNNINGLRFNHDYKRKKSPTRKFINEFDSYLDTALRKREEFFSKLSQLQNEYPQPSSTPPKMMMKNLDQSRTFNHSTKFFSIDNHNQQYQLSNFLGLEQQIVGCVTFFKSYR